MSKFEITKRKDGDFQFNLKAANGQVILTSEGYTTKENCKKGIESVKKNSQIEAKFESKESANKKHYFNLKSGNGQIVGTSQMYESEANKNNGIASVMKNAKDAQIVDLTLQSQD